MTRNAKSLINRVFAALGVKNIEDAEKLEPALTLAVEEWLKEALLPREVKMIQSFFGICRMDRMTNTQIGVAFDLTTDRVRQIQAKALRKLIRSVRQRNPKAMWVAQVAGIIMPVNPERVCAPTKLGDDDPVDCLGLVVRTENLLKAGEVYTIGKLKGCSELDLLRMPGLGNKSLVEIKDALGVYGLKLSEADPSVAV